MGKRERNDPREVARRGRWFSCLTITRQLQYKLHQVARLSSSSSSLCVRLLFLYTLLLLLFLLSLSSSLFTASRCIQESVSSTCFPRHCLIFRVHLIGRQCCLLCVRSHWPMAHAHQLKHITCGCNLAPFSLASSPLSACQLQLGPVDSACKVTPGRRSTLCCRKLLSRLAEETHLFIDLLYSDVGSFARVNRMESNETRTKRVHREKEEKKERG